MGIRWLKMDKMSDKMRQDGGKMRKMKDVSSVLGPSRGEDLHRAANNTASRGPGEVPPLGRVNPPPGPPQNPDSRLFHIKVSVSLETSSNFLGFPSRFTMFFNVDVTESR